MLFFTLFSIKFSSYLLPSFNIFCSGIIGPLLIIILLRFNELMKDNIERTVDVINVIKSACKGIFLKIKIPIK